MVKLHEIKLAHATRNDFARAINYSMRKSKDVAKVYVTQLNLQGPVLHKHIDKLYPNNTFSSNGVIHPEKSKEIASGMQEIFTQKKELSEYNMLDLSNAIIKFIRKNK